MIKPALFILCLLPSGIAGAFEADTPSQAPPYFLDQLALGLQHAPGPVRADLAYTAVAELASAYAAESRLARAEIQHRPGQKKLRRWSVAVQRLAAELDALAQTVTSQSSVQTRIGPGNSLYLVVDGSPVLISGPRSKDQAALEQRIVARFCSLHPCETLLPESSRADTPAVAKATSAATHWGFSESMGPVCSSDDGLVFRFDDLSDLRRKREACARVVAELHLLAAEIAGYRSTGKRVDWQGMKITLLPLGPQHQVRLNDNGDALVLYLPALAAAPELFSLVRPWLAAKVRGDEQAVTIGNAEALLPPVGFLGQ